jgi:hypothetical protein
MWIVRVALDRPYTFIVLALMILIMSVVAISRTPTDIFGLSLAQTIYDKLSELDRPSNDGRLP